MERRPGTMMMAAAVIALAGCATPAEQAARMEREMGRLVQVYGPACQKLGFQAETDPWRNCVLRLSERDTYERRSGYPMTSTCFGSRGLMHCTTF